MRCCAWFGVMLLCSLPGISSNAWKSWWGDFPRMDGMFTQLHLLAFFFVLIQTFKQERQWLTLFTASLFASVVMGLTGLIQAEGIDLFFRSNSLEGRIQGATGNPNFFGSYMLLNLFIALFFLTRNGKKDFYPFIAKVGLFVLIALDACLLVWDSTSGGQILSMGLQFLPLSLFALALHGAILFWFFMRRSVWTGTIFLGLICLYDLYWLNQSQARASAGGLASGLALVLLMYLWKGTDRRLKWAAALLILLVVVTAIGVFSARSSHFIQNYPLLARLTATSFEEHRFIAWKSGLSGTLDRPILGWGLEHYRKAFDLHAPAELFQGIGGETWDDRAHNIILDAGITTGLLGLAVMVTFYGFLFFLLLRGWFRNRGATEYLSIAGLLAAYLVQNLFSFDTINTYGILFFILAYAVYLCGKANPIPRKLPASAASNRMSPESIDYLILA